MRLIPLMVLLALTLHAGTIVDATATSVLLQHGDSLSFQVLTWNFGFNAARFGLNPDPTDVAFTFVTAPVSGPATMSVWLESPDASDSTVFGDPLAFSPGFLSNSRFRGAVSTLQSYLHLSPELSANIFGAGSALLVLRNEGPDLLLGLPPNTLRQDLSVSLTGGPLSVGALSGGVSLQSAPVPTTLLSGGVTLQSVPEPATVLPGLFALIVMGLAHRHKESTVCQPLIHSDTI